MHLQQCLLHLYLKHFRSPIMHHHHQLFKSSNSNPRFIISFNAFIFPFKFILWFNIYSTTTIGMMIGTMTYLRQTKVVDFNQEMPQVVLEGVIVMSEATLTSIWPEKWEMAREQSGRI